MQITREDIPATGVELLLFRLGGAGAGQPGELFGLDLINVREIVAMPVVNIRGAIVQVLDLPSIAGCVPATGRNIMLVTDVGDSAQAFAVEAVEEIVALSDADLVPESYGASGGLISAIARIDDGQRLAQVLDVRTVLQRVAGMERTGSACRARNPELIA
jgi:two-component system chemotaxis response regulator CheV